MEGQRGAGVFAVGGGGIITMNFDGMKINDAIALALEMAQPEPGEALSAPPQIVMTNEGDERQWGFCQVCEHTIGSCICEDGPY